MQRYKLKHIIFKVAILCLKQQWNLYFNLVLEASFLCYRDPQETIGGKIFGVVKGLTEAWIYRRHSSELKPHSREIRRDLILISRIRRFELWDIADFG